MLKQAQRGASGLFVAVILLLVAAGALAVLALSRGTGQVERGAQASDRFKVLQEAFVQYVAANGRLPCPANPALDTGDENPVVPAAACSSPTGTVPWRVIGARKEDAVDPWGGKIAYRVYTGAAGSLTQEGGASMVNCDTVEPAPQPVDVDGLCHLLQDTLEGSFLFNKGLRVNSFGTAINDAAYLLVSHGPTGLGAFTSAGVQKPPLPNSADELANLSAGGPFVARAASAQDVGPEDATHFDDVLAFAKLGELVRRAGQGGREWPEPPAPPPAPPPPAAPSSVTLNTATLSAALGGPATYGDTGQSTIDFSAGGVVISAFNSSGSQDISFDRSRGVEGIGTVGGNSAISSNGLEGVRLAYGMKARKLSITFNDFGFGGGGNFAERAELRFFDGATLLSTQIAQGCRTDGRLATFTFDLVTADFDNVEVRSLVTTANSKGAVRDSLFFISAIASCSATDPTCQTALYAPGNACP